MRLLSQQLMKNLVIPSLVLGNVIKSKPHEMEDLGGTDSSGLVVHIQRHLVTLVGVRILKNK